MTVFTPDFQLAFVRASIPLAFGTFDRFLLVNDAMSGYLGRSKEELCRLGWRDFTVPEDLPASLELVAKLSSGEIDRFELDKRYVRGDGEVVWGRVHATALRLPESGTPYLLIQIDDIGPRKQTEERLRVASTQLSEAKRLARLQRRQALEIHDNVVQGLAVAKLSLELGDWERGARAVARTLQAAQSMVADLMGETPVEAGSLVRREPARLEFED
ncbi:MAG: PAS domain S-box protein [Actinomycetota bacterium]